MPLEKIEIANDYSWALWRIGEDEEELAAQVKTFETVSEAVSNPMKRLEWYAGRVLVKLLLEKWDYTFRGVTKNEFGKPFPIACPYQLALSHSYPYVAALIDKHHSVGIDVEQPKTKLLKIAPRVLDAGELLDAGDDLTKHCIYWCAKESLIKVHGKKDLIFAENLKISPFQLEKEGDIIGRIIVPPMETIIPLHYLVTEKFILVWSKNETR